MASGRIACHSEDMTAGLIVLAVVLVAGTAIGLWRRSTDGRFGVTDESGPAGQPIDAALLAALGADRPADATLLQFSSAFCAPCRATRRVLGEVAELVPGVTHVEIDAEHHLDVVRSLRVLRTPTTLILDAEGREVSRASGQPQRDQVLAALARD
jgi:thiol-disulfide isomerase/thioredoxin